MSKTGDSGDHSRQVRETLKADGSAERSLRNEADLLMAEEAVDDTSRKKLQPVDRVQSDSAVAPSPIPPNKESPSRIGEGLGRQVDSKTGSIGTVTSVHPTPGSSDRQTPPQPTDRSVQGSKPESKPISVERQQGTESKSVGYPVEQGKSSHNASVEPNRPFVAGDEVLAKRAQGMSVQNPETNQHQNRPTGLDSGNFKTGGPNNRADSGVGKAESELQRHDRSESLPTRLEKPDNRTATAPIGLRGEELLDYGLRRPTATTASGTIDSKAEPQHKQQQAFPNSDLKVAGSDNQVKRTDPSDVYSADVGSEFRKSRGTGFRKVAAACHEQLFS